MIWLWSAFFVSGIAGISYELIWLRYLVHLFGASTPAVSTTVAIFFAGLALGAILGGAAFSRIRHSLLGYGFLELSIGAVAATVPAIFHFAEGLLISMPQANGEGFLLHFALASLMMLLPCTLLGATFPAMAAVVQRHFNPVFSTSSFYGYNTLGAVAGCLLVSLVFLPHLGASTTNWIMVCFNLTVGALMIWQHTVQKTHSPQRSAPLPREPFAPTLPDTPSPAKARSTQSVQPMALPLAFFIAGGSGFLSIGIEVLWTRALALSFPATVYEFALVLASFLAGIGLGSLAIARRSHSGIPSRKLLGLLYTLAAAGTLCTLFIFPRIMGWVFSLFDHQLVTSWTSYIGAIALLSFLTMLPATLSMGAALPLLIGLCTGHSEHPSRMAGWLYGLNMAGGIIGSLAATFILMPWLGLSRLLMLLALAYLVLGLLLVQRRTQRLGLGTALVFAGTLLLTGNYPEVNPLRDLPHERTLYYKDAPSATVTVLEQDDGVRSLRFNNHYGLSQTSLNTVTMQYRLGLLPLLLHPRPQRVLLIGFATGTTLAAMADQGLPQLDCVELHPLLYRLAPYFSAVNRQVGKRPGVRLIAADGRRFLLQNGPGYDVIVGDLYLPRNAGVGAMYSLEHFRAARRRLTHGGVFVAWLPMFQLGPEDMATVIRTFLEIFPHAFAVSGNQDSTSAVLGLVGQREKHHHRDILTRNWAKLDERLRVELAASIKRSFGAEATAHQGLSFALRVELPTSTLQHWARGAAPNTLDHPRIEYSAPRSMLQASLAGTSLSQANLDLIVRLRARSAVRQPRD